MELEGPGRRLFQKIDENDPDEGDSPGNGEKWTDSKYFEEESSGLVFYGLSRMRERKESSVSCISRLSGWAYSDSEE